jgi:hypothetical protein
VNLDAKALWQVAEHLQIMTAVATVLKYGPPLDSSCRDVVPTALNIHSQGSCHAATLYGTTNTSSYLSFVETRPLRLGSKRPATQAVRRRVAGGFARASIYYLKGDPVFLGDGGWATEPNGFEPKIDPESKDFRFGRGTAIGECGTWIRGSKNESARPGWAGKEKYVY